MTADAQTASAAVAPQEDVAALAAVLGGPVDSAQRIGAGRNSRVYRVRSAGRDYAAKFYFKPTADGRDRLEVEFNGLSFLWRRGLRCIAEPITADQARQVAVYAYIPGAAVPAAEATDGMVDQMVDFIRLLSDIKADDESRRIGPAAEAFFSADGVIQNLGQRLARLTALKSVDGPYAELRRFLELQFEPALARFSAGARSGAGRELPQEHRTLSPSDLGFHNALSHSDGHLAFVDFEYFGWDDPAKTLSDCMLHPMMALPAHRKLRLAAGLDRVFGRIPGWRARVGSLYPLFALKWCMIMLNEFRNEQIERRRYVDREAEQIGVIQRRQLAAARTLLENTVRADGAFPYWESNQ